MSIKSTDLNAAAKRAAGWLASRQTPMGNYRGLEQPREDGIYADTDDLGCYYKSAYTLRVAGEPAAAGRCLNYVAQRFMSDEGDFYNSPEERSSGSYGPVYCQLYPNAWLMRASSSLGWIGLSKKVLGFMLKYRTENGGFYAQVNPKTNVVDSNATAVGALCCLQGGLTDLAVQSGDFLLTMLDQQKDPSKFYARWVDGEGFLTDVSDVPEGQIKYWYINAEQGGQAYWVWAWPMNVLTYLSEVTGEEKYLKGALKIHDFLSGGHDDAFHFASAGKGGWGSAMLYRKTGEEKFLKTCLSQMDFILSHQHKDGYMVGTGVNDLDGQPIRTTYDFTADFTSWLVDSAAELATRE